MKVTLILALTVILLAKGLTAHSGYFYEKPEKKFDHPEPIFRADETPIQADFPIEEILNAQKQNIFQSVLESFFKPVDSSDSTTFESSNSQSTSNTAVYNPFAISNIGYGTGSESITSNVGVYNPFATSSNHFGTIYPEISSNKGPSNRCGRCTCGLPNKNRIVGGTAVRSNKYPWTVQLLQGRNGRLFCGGTLIHEQYVLTAAHCVQGQKWQNIHVRLNQYDKNIGAAAAITKSLQSANVHSGYNTNTLENDIAILKMSEPVDINGDIRPACLPPNDSYNVDHKTGVVAGWGLTQEQGSISSILREVDVPIITNQACKRTKYKNMIKDSMLCAGLVQSGGKDACQGDSGGPLTVNENGYYRLIGAVSYGYGCAKPDAPGVYTRVSKYLNWIYQQTSDGCYCQK